MLDSHIKDNYLYDPDTGFIYRKSDLKNQLGWYSNGYVKVNIKSKKYYAHRLAWFLYYGIWPDFQIDHIDGCRCNNKIENLRNADYSKNNYNRGKCYNNSSGYKGVSVCRKTGHFIARIGHTGTYEYLGYFYTAEEAYAAYCKAAKELHKEFHNLG